MNRPQDDPVTVTKPAAILMTFVADASNVVVACEPLRCAYVAYCFASSPTSLPRLGVPHPLARSHPVVAEALELLAPVYGWFTEGFDTAALKDAKALLAELA